MVESLEIEWRTIPGWEGLYEVSEHGQVRSMDRVLVHARSGPSRYRGRLLKMHQDKDGRDRVHLYRGGKASRYLVHYLVALAFIGPRPPGYDVCHRDDHKRNNHYSNLRYDTKAENMMDRVRNGIHHNANKSSCPSGHPYDGGNLIVTRTRTGVNRRCRECRRADSLARYYRSRDQRKATT